MNFKFCRIYRLGNKLRIARTEHSILEEIYYFIKVTINGFYNDLCDIA